MREILFRGKRVDNGEWVEGSYIPRWFDGARVSQVIIVDDSEKCEGILDEPLTKYYVSKDTVCEFIGEVDKNKKEIFEGDEIMVKIFLNEFHTQNPTREFKGIVEYAKYRCCYVVKTIEHCYQSFDDIIKDDEIYDIEIIGNKWDKND